MDAAAHDAAVAAISHLPLVVAAALVEAVAGACRRAAAGLAGCGEPGRDRLARHDPAGPRRRRDGAAIVATNAGASPRGSATSSRVLDGLARRARAARRPGRGGVEARLRGQRASGSSDAVMSDGSASSSCRATVVPDEGGWYGLRTDGLDGVRGRRRGRRALRAADRDGAGPVASSRSSRTSCCATASATS